MQRRQSVAITVAGALLGAGLGFGVLADDPGGSDTPADLKRLLEAKDGEGIQRLVAQRLREHLGDPFPDLVLRKRTLEHLNLRDVLAPRTLIFLAATDFDGSVETAKRLRDHDWHVEGADKIITLVVTPDVPRLKQLVPSFDDAYLTEWPLPSYLTYCRGYPVFFYVVDGVFRGFQIPSSDRPIAVETMIGQEE
jgi:hypothetical protein